MMPVLAPFIRLRPEVEALDWERIRGHILFKDLISPLDSLEKDPEWLFLHTFPTSVLQAYLEQIRAKQSGRTTVGAFLLEGGLGSGKSHLLTFFYHLFTNPDRAQDWLIEHKLNTSIRIPRQATVVVLPLLEFPDQPLWKPMFEQLGRPDLIPDKTTTAPTSESIREAFGERSVVLLIDEIVGWYGTLPGPLKAATRNFLQNLAEEALRRPDVFLFVGILSGTAAEQADTEDIKSRLTRPPFYSQPLMRRDDRLRIVFFRLFERPVDRVGAEPIIKRYMTAYSDLREQLGFDWDLAEIQARLRESYPFHPNLLDVIFDRYATVPQTQAARGALGLLAELVVREQHHADLLLPADVSPDTYYEWMSRVNFELTRRVLDDLDSLAEDEDATVKARILHTAFLYSLGEVKQPGATDEEIFLGTVRPEQISALDVDGTLREMTATVEHLHRENGRWVVKLEENVDALVYRQATRGVEPEEVQEIAKEAIKAQLKGLAYGVYVSPPDTIPDSPSFKIVVFLERQTNGELEAFCTGRTWRNALLILMPKMRQDRALDAEGELLARKVKAARSLLEDKGRSDTAVRRKLQKIAKTCMETLCDKISIEWDAVRWFLGEDNKLGWRFDPVRLAATEVSEKALSYGNVTDLKKDIRTLLGREEDRGLPYRELRDSFFKYRGLAVLLGDDRLREALRDIEGELVFIGRDGRRSDGRLPSWFQDAQVILARYAPTPPPAREIPEEEEPKPQMPLWGERGELAEEVSIGVSLGEVEGPETQPVSWEGRNVSTPALNVEREQDITQFYEEAKLTLVWEYGGPTAAANLARELSAMADLIKAKGSRHVRAELSLKLPDMLSPEEVLEFLKGFDDRDTEKARFEGKVRRK